MNCILSRSAIDEAREINHHGMTVKVGGEDEDESSSVVDMREYDKEVYNKELISRDEKKQDAALRQA